MNYPLRPNHAQQLRETAITVHNAVKYPGRILSLPIAMDVSTVSAMAFIGESVLSTQKTFYTPSPEWITYLSRTGASLSTLNNSDYHFYIALDPEQLDTMRHAALMNSPTLFIGATFGAGTSIEIQAPGGQGINQIDISGLPDTFWDFCIERLQHQTLWDIVFVSKHKIFGLSQIASLKVLPESGR